MPRSNVPPFPDPITRAECCARLARPLAYVRRLEARGAVRVYRHPDLGIVVSASDIERVRLDAQAPPRGDKGARAALAFELFAAGRTRADVLVRLRADVSEIEALWAAFVRLSSRSLVLAPADVARLDAAGLGVALQDGPALVSLVLRLRAAPPRRRALTEGAQGADRSESVDRDALKQEQLEED